MFSLIGMSLGVVLSVGAMALMLGIGSKVGIAWHGLFGAWVLLVGIVTGGMGLWPPVLIAGALVAHGVVGGVGYVTFRKVFKKHKMVQMRTYGLDMPVLEFTTADGQKLMRRKDAERYVGTLDQAALVAGLNPVVWGIKSWAWIHKSQVQDSRNQSFKDDVEEAMNLDRVRGKILSELGQGEEFERSLKITEYEDMESYVRTLNIKMLEK